MVHDQATIQELKSMFAEMKELLQQQVLSHYIRLFLILSTFTSRLYVVVLPGLDKGDKLPEEHHRRVSRLR